MKRLKGRIEHKLGIIFGGFITPRRDREDFAFIIRFGFGSNRKLTNFEAGIAGYAIYVSREPAPPQRSLLSEQF